MATNIKQNFWKLILQKKYFTALSFTVVILLLILCVYFVMDGIIKDSKNLVSLQNQIATLNVQTKNIDIFKKSYNDYLPNLQKVDQMFADPQNPLDFIKFLEDTASLSGINLQISAPTFSKESGLNIMSVQLTLQGNFSDTLNFLEKIESGQYLIKIKDLSVGNYQATDKNQKSITNGVQTNFLLEVLTK
jgi:hypothetical protein